MKGEEIWGARERGKWGNYISVLKIIFQTLKAIVENKK